MHPSKQAILARVEELIRRIIPDPPPPRQQPAHKPCHTSQQAVISQERGGNENTPESRGCTGAAGPGASVAYSLEEQYLILCLREDMLRTFGWIFSASQPAHFLTYRWEPISACQIFGPAGWDEIKASKL